MSIQDSYDYDQDMENDGESLLVRRRKGLTSAYITVEPIMFCLGFTINFTDGVTIDVVERNICYQFFNRSEDLCHENLDQDIKPEIEDLIADYNLVNIIIQNLLPLILVMFVGSWSDNNGRKPFIIIPLLGYTIYYLSWALLSYIRRLPIWYYEVPSIALSVSGMTTCLFVCTLSYLGDNFDTNQLTFRYSLHGGIFILGGLIGDLLSDYIISLSKPYGYQVIFLTSVLVSLLALFYSIFLLKETRVRPHGVDRSVLFDSENIKSAAKIMLVNPEKGRILSLLLLTVLLCDESIKAGDEGILYLVGKVEYGWSYYKYNMISIVATLVSAGSQIILAWILMCVLGWTNATVLIINLAVFVIAEVLRALSLNHVMFWIATVVYRLGSCAGPAIMTEIYDTVSEEHYGKAFTMVSACSALTPIISIPLYTVIYKIFLPHHTLYIYFLSAVLAVIALCASVHIDFKKNVAYNL